MGFQSTVSVAQGFGVPGELFTDSPYQGQTYTINSVLPAYNIIGATCCTITSQGFCEAGSGGAGGFAGFLANPKVVALYGSSLAPTLTVPDQTIVECITMGVLTVTLPAAAAIGDYVVYNTTTGAISTITPPTPLAVGTKFANAIVSYFTVSGAGLAVITINPTFVIPQPA